MIKEHLKAIDNLMPSDEAVASAVERAIKAKESGKVIEMKKNNKKRFAFIGAAAAGLAVIIGLSAVFISSAPASDNVKSSSEKQSANSFVLKANAADLPKNAGFAKSVIGAFAGSSEGGWAMNVKKDGFQDYFTNYLISKLEIDGKNIKSVTVKSNKKGIYFGITPDVEPETLDIKTAISELEKKTKLSKNIEFIYTGDRSVPVTKEEAKRYKKAVKAEKKKYSDTESIKNSRYTKKEIRDSVSLIEDFVCDKFTYNNLDKEDKLKISNSIKLIIESDHGDKEIAAWLNKLNAAEAKIQEEKLSGSVEDKLCLIVSKYSDKITKKMINGAAIDVKVTFMDNTSQIKKLKLDYYTDTDGFPWITIK